MLELTRLWHYQQTIRRSTKSDKDVVVFRVAELSRPKGTTYDTLDTK